MLFGRDSELDTLARLLGAARDGRGSALVLHGPAGIGKTALLRAAAEHAAAHGFTTLRATGIESEAGIPFAALHMLLAPVLDRLDALPAPQAAALRGALGLDAPAGADDVRFLLGLGLLTLLGDLADHAPVLCLVDDTHWLDAPSVAVLAFAARRLGAERVAVVFASRDDGTTDKHSGTRGLTGLPTLSPTALAAEDATAVLAAHSPGLAAGVHARVLAESSGNPLALKELAGALSHAQRSGSAPLPAALPAPDAVARTFRRRLAELSPGARSLVVVAAADRSGDIATLVTAARGLGCELADLDAAVDAGVLVVTGDAYAFRHPLIRSTAYQDAGLTERVNAHRSLADALEGDSHRDHQHQRQRVERAGGGRSDVDHGENEVQGAERGEYAPELAATWHRALAATGPDADLAETLARAADTAWARGGSPASAYELAARLHPERRERTRLLTRAAQTALVGGETDYAIALSARAAELTEDPVLRGALAMIDGTAENFRGHPTRAARLLLAGAEDMVTAARADSPEAASSPGFPAVTLLTVAAGYAWFSDDAGTVRRTAALAERSAPGTPAATALAGLAALTDVHPAAGIPPLAALVGHERTAPSRTLIDRLFVLRTARILGDDTAVAELAEAESARCRARGTATALPDVLAAQAYAQLAVGLHRDAEATVAEALDFARETNQLHILDDLHAITLRIAAVAGDEERCRDIVREREHLADDPSLALLDLGLGRYEDAVSRLTSAVNASHSYRTSVIFSIPDLVEAAVRAGRPDTAAKALGRFLAWADAAATAWTRAVALRCRALLDPVAGPELGPTPDHELELGSELGPEALFVAALGEHARSTRPFEQARTELLYGEWLRRARRRTDARPVLRSAEARFARLGATPWVERTRTELRATGESTAAYNAVSASGPPTTGSTVDASTAAVPGPGSAAFDSLTPQELQVVRLASAGASNQEIATQLFLSRRTVEYHLYKAYPKLGVSSRRELLRLGR